MYDRMTDKSRNWKSRRWLIEIIQASDSIWKTIGIGVILAWRAWTLHGINGMESTAFFISQAGFICEDTLDSNPREVIDTSVSRCSCFIVVRLDKAVVSCSVCPLQTSTSLVSYLVVQWIAIIATNPTHELIVSVQWSIIVINSTPLFITKPPSAGALVLC